MRSKEDSCAWICKAITQLFRRMKAIMMKAFRKKLELFSVLDMFNKC